MSPISIHYKYIKSLLRKVLSKSAALGTFYETYSYFTGLVIENFGLAFSFTLGQNQFENRLCIYYLTFTGSNYLDQFMFFNKKKVNQKLLKIDIQQ